MHFETSEEMVNDYYNYCREVGVLLVVLTEGTKQIGVPWTRVEMDTAKFKKRKLQIQKGRPAGHPSGYWKEWIIANMKNVFGACEPSV